MLIIGSGPAGLSAAIYGARAGMEPIVVQGLQPGGQLTITTDVENYPGFRDVIQGPWLMQEMQAQAEHVGTRMLWDTITLSVDLSGPPFTARSGDSGDIYEGDTLVIATGAQAKWLGVPGEQELGGKGVSACATCDGFFYRGKKGRGDRRRQYCGGGSALPDQPFDDVTLIHRRDSLRAEKILQDRLFAHPKISVLWNKRSRASRRRGRHDRRCGWSIPTPAKKASSTEGAFVAIGHAPSTELFKGKLEIDAGGYLWLNPARPRPRSPACSPAAT
jgi:thioredoxin reductase (NADPH)